MESPRPGLQAKPGRYPGTTEERLGGGEGGFQPGKQTLVCVLNLGLIFTVTYVLFFLPAPLLSHGGFS